MTVKVKLDLGRLSDNEFMAKAEGIVTSMTGNANFTTPAPALANITTAVEAMRDLINERLALLSQMTEKTVAIRAQRDAAADILIAEGEYVQDIANASVNPLNPPAAIIESAGMDVADSNGTAVGAMPAVEGLTATAGDADGEVDLHWTAIRRGLKSYIIEKTEDPAALTGWGLATISTKSSATISGLTSGKRYWFRVAAIGAAGQGPWSPVATKTAP